MNIQQFCLVLAFAVYAIAMNALVGTILFLAVSGLKSKSSEFHEKLGKRLSGLLPGLLGATLVLGFAQLFVVDSAYGRLFVGETMQAGWLVPALIATVATGGFGLLVYSGWRSGRPSVIMEWLLLLLALGMMLVSTTNALTMLDPTKYDMLQGLGFGNAPMELSENIVWARLFHFLLSGPAIGGLLVALVAGAWAAADSDWAASARAMGVKWFTVATIANFLVGLWYLFAIPRPFRMPFLGEGKVETGVLWLGVLLALAAMHFCRKSVKTGLWLAFFAIALMSAARQFLRDARLSDLLAVASQSETGSRLLLQAGGCFVLGLILLAVAFRMAGKAQVSQNSAP